MSLFEMDEGVLSPAYRAEHSDTPIDKLPLDDASFVPRFTSSPVKSPHSTSWADSMDRTFVVQQVTVVKRGDESTLVQDEKEKTLCGLPEVSVVVLATYGSYLDFAPDRGVFDAVMQKKPPPIRRRVARRPVVRMTRTALMREELGRAIRLGDAIKVRLDDIFDDF